MGSDQEALKFDPGKLHTGTGVKGWWFQGGHLFRESDGVALPASSDGQFWQTQIAAFEALQRNAFRRAPDENRFPEDARMPGHTHDIHQSAETAFRLSTPEEGEWPKRDAVPRMASLAPGWASHSVIGQRPAEVTPEMMASAMSAFAETYLVCTLGAAEDAVVSIIRAALAYQPVELVSPAESALTRERDEARAERDSLVRLAAAANVMIDSFRAELMVAHDKLARQAKALGDAANTIAALTHTESTPDPIANAVRAHVVAQRKIGG